MMRLELVTGEICHVFNKSIAGYKIFNDESDYIRMAQVLMYYQKKNKTVRFSEYLRREKTQENIMQDAEETEKLVNIVAYCLMSTHIHLILEQLQEKGISEYMRKILDSYSRYFNIKHNRKGPLWEGRFKKVIVETEGQLLHLTRYIHLNPVSAYLVNKPEDWRFSSYGEYLSEDSREKFCNYKKILDFKPETYRKFVENNIEYQRELANIKNFTFDHDFTS